MTGARLDLCISCISVWQHYDYFSSAIPSNLFIRYMQRVLLLWSCMLLASFAGWRCSALLTLRRPCRRTSAATSHYALQHALHQVNVEGLSCDPVMIRIPANHYGIEEILILEASSTSQETLVERALELESSGSDGDPYGSVLWPAAKTIARRLLAMEPSEMQKLTILELGSGTGLVAMCAAMCGARKVVATDFNPFTLRILERAAQMQPGCRQIPAAQLSTELFDVCDFEKYPTLPPCDLLLIADLLYSPITGEAVARRVHQAVQRNTQVMIADSPLRPGRPRFLETLSKLLQRPVEFAFVQGDSVSEGARHELISARKDTFQTLDMALLEL